jgi:PAS domain S-box-containing protein
MIGYSLEELKGFNGLDLFTPESQEMAREKIASGDPGPYEAMCVKKDGSVFPVEIRARMIHQEGRDIRVGVVRDLTEQNRLTERLRDSEQLYRTLVEGVTAGVAVIDTQGRYLLVNDTACEHNALSRDQLMGSTLHDLYSQETADTYLARIRRIITSGQDESACEQTLIHGCQRWFQIGFFPLKNGDGQYDRVIALAFDIHEQKQLEQELARKNKQYKKLYENAPTALFRSRISDGKIIMCNTALSKMNGFETPEDCIQSNFLSKDTYVDPKRRRQLIDRLKQEGTVTNFEAELNVPDGGKKWISISAEIFEEQGYLEGSLMDITAMRALTRAEKTILHHLMQGKSNKEIARHLERAVRTVEDHRANIMGKLEVNNIVDLTQIALNLPTLQDDPSDG